MASAMRYLAQPWFLHQRAIGKAHVRPKSSEKCAFMLNCVKQNTCDGRKLRGFQLPQICPMFEVQQCCDRIPVGICLLEAGVVSALKNKFSITVFGAWDQDPGHWEAVLLKNHMQCNT